METITTYKYARGEIEKLRKGDLSSLETGESLGDLDLSVGRGIIIPEFVGVYQDQEIANREEGKEYRKIVEILEDIKNTAMSDLLQKMGLKARFNPKLIHIGYDSRIYRDGNLVRQFLGQNSERIRISPYENIPNFGQKNPVAEDIYIEQLEEILKKTHDMEQEEKIEKVTNVARQAYDGLFKQLKDFGLTREEFVFLSFMGKLKNPPKKRKIISSPPQIRIISSLMELFSGDEDY